MTDAEAYEGALRQLHHLIAAQEGDSVIAEALRDVMDRHWWKMSSQEQEQMRRLSEELYKVG